MRLGCSVTLYKSVNNEEACRRICNLRQVLKISNQYAKLPKIAFIHGLNGPFSRRIDGSID